MSGGGARRGRLAGPSSAPGVGERLDLGPGDWVLLPAGTPHRLVRTERGTSWLAVHLHPGAPRAAR